MQSPICLQTVLNYFLRRALSTLSTSSQSLVPLLLLVVDNCVFLSTYPLLNSTILNLTPSPADQLLVNHCCPH